MTDIHTQLHYKPLSITTDDDLGLRLDVRDLTSDMEDLKSDVGISNRSWGAEIPGILSNLTPVHAFYLVNWNAGSNAAIANIRSPLLLWF